MERLRVDDVLKLLPELDELRPLVDGLMATSVPDPERRWTASGELETVGQRLVHGARLQAEWPGYVERMARHMEAVYGGVAAAVQALAAGDRQAAGQSLLDAARAEEAAGRPGRAEAYALAARDAVRGERDRGVEVHALRRAARAARARGRLADAASRYEASYGLALDAREEDHAVVAAIGRGNVAVDQGRWAEAETWYRRALDLLAGSHGPREERAHVYLDLSIATRQQGDYRQSREWLQQAQAEAEALGSREGDAVLHNGWGRLHQAEGNLADAEWSYRTALLRADMPDARVTVAVNLGEVLLDRGLLLEAAEHARMAEAEALRHRVVTRLPEVYRLLGRVAATGGRPDAMVFFERALEIVRELDLPDFEAALTLEAYGTAVREDPTLAAERLREAARRYGALDMDHMRRRAEAEAAVVEGTAPASGGEPE